MNAENVVQALYMALKERTTSKELIHHSDRSLRYTLEIYQNKLKAGSVLPSMTDGYDFDQNTLVDRVNGILK